MPARTGSTYQTSQGVVNTKKRTYTGKGAAPSGSKKVAAPKLSEVPMTTTYPGGKTVSSGYGNKRAAARARRATRAARRSARVVAQVTRDEPQTRSQRSGKTRVLASTKAKVKRPAPPTSKPVKFKGRKTVGTPTLKSLRLASKSGRLKVNKKGFVTTPEVRIAAKKLKKARKAYAKVATPKIEGVTHGADATKFAERLAKETKLDPKFVGAWVQSEGGGFAAGGEAGKENWLGVGYPGEQTELSRSPHLNRSPKEAAHFTAEWLKGAPGIPGGGWEAEGGIPNIVPMAAGKGPKAALSALEQSGWGTDVSAVAQNLGSISARSGKASPKLTRKLKKAKAKAEKLGLNTQPKGRGAAPTPREVHGSARKYFVKADGSEHLKFVPLLARQLEKLAKASGEPIVVNSGFRTLAEQEASYADYLAGGNLAAVPGTSNHEFGLAADLELSSTQRSLLSKFGLGLPVAGEDWHVEITDPAMRSKAGYDSPGSTSPVSVGGVTGAFSSGGLSSSSISSYASATGTSPAAVKKQLKNKKLKPNQIFRKLNELGVGVGSPTDTETKRGSAPSTSELDRLEAKYSKAA